MTSSLIPPAGSGGRVGKGGGSGDRAGTKSRNLERESMQDDDDGIRRKEVGVPLRSKRSATQPEVRGVWAKKDRVWAKKTGSGQRKRGSGQRTTGVWAKKEGGLGKERRGLGK